MKNLESPCKFINNSPVWKTRGRNSVNIDEDDEDFQFTRTKSSTSATPASNIHADFSNTNADLKDEFSEFSSLFNLALNFK